MQLGPPLCIYLVSVILRPPLLRLATATPLHFSPPSLSYSAEISCSVLPCPPLSVFYVQGEGNPHFHFVVLDGVPPSVSVSAEGRRTAEDVAEQLLLAAPHRLGKIVPPDELTP